MKGTKAKPRQEATRCLTLLLLLLLKLLLVLKLDLLLVLQLSFQPQSFELVSLVSTKHF